MNDREQVLEQWIIYDHPSDHPDHFVVRCWKIWRDSGRATYAPTMEAWLRDDLHGAREVIRANFPGGYRIARDDESDPVIVEAWV